MKRMGLKAICLVSILSAFVLSVSVVGSAQRYSSKSRAAVRQTNMTGSLTARLVEPEKKAKGKAATVEVIVRGVTLIDPAKVGERPIKGEAHLHYRVDDGPVIATTATKLSFHELTPGQHTIMVMLAANNHTPLGPQQTLTVTIP